MVAERSVSLKRCMVTYTENIRIANVDMSSLNNVKNIVTLNPRFPK